MINKNVPEDERTMEELRKIANTIFKCVQFTTECPSGQESGKVPVLDLQLYLGEDRLVKHEYYEKPCTNDFVIPAKSAHSIAVSHLYIHSCFQKYFFYNISWQLTVIYSYVAVHIS